MPGGGPLQLDEQVHQRGLAGPGRSHDRVAGGRGEGEVDAVQRDDLLTVDLVELAQLLAAHGQAGHSSASRSRVGTAERSTAVVATTAVRQTRTRNPPAKATTGRAGGR